MLVQNPPPSFIAIHLLGLGDRVMKDIFFSSSKTYLMHVRL